NEGQRVLGTQSRQTERRKLPRNDDQVNYIRQVRDQPVQDRVHWCLSAEMMIVVKYHDQLLLDALHNLVDQDIRGTFGLLREVVTLLEVSEGNVPEARHALANSL